MIGDHALDLGREFLVHALSLHNSAAQRRKRRDGLKFRAAARTPALAAR
jgi:hypothetical protein